MATLTTASPTNWALPSSLSIDTILTSDSIVPSGVPLLTRWSYPADCTSTWVTFDPTLRQALNAATPTVWAVDWKSAGQVVMFSSSTWTAPTHAGYTSCRPYGLRGQLYSPGLCPEGQVMAALTEVQYITTSNEKVVTQFRGMCCWRYVSTSIH